MKIFAFYLPQFHEIPENNEWWGEGFTEWVNVKSAKALFTGHNQPRTPLNNNYYDLKNSEVMASQAAMARKYGVDGFCFYHYWFGGKQLLQKPLLALLENKNIDVEFCLSWANEPWARTWDGRDKDVLMPQQYGGKKDWKSHFLYLVQFFKDPRYTKIDGKPMLLIYKSKDIPNFDEMLEYWDTLAAQYGFVDGLHIVETMGGKQSEPVSTLSSAVVEFEPSLSLGKGADKAFWLINKFKMVLNKGLYRFNFNSVAKISVSRNVKYGNKKRYLGCFPGWDNTPRKGIKGVVFERSSPENFENYLASQIRKSESESIVFINAWNEWAEGAYLEPDIVSGYSYLESVMNAKIKTLS
ncbi:glycoside hydrolase family 99-like domain-containing protein [Vibrio vulnificus]|uniref:glycosyltransferase WbsX family protein n=1 Tax=Vibrio vulnificus TaxID=672 RepID=UPI001CDD4E2E|nr:glycoside hydrolase family 99-like domain-containing protein [Vibrio vulnificus]MCA4015308.1 glycoside hydrolase family 99-like domain-containing protein [Vibrio vulnificus]